MDKQYNFINLNEFTWQLNTAILGGTFAVFSLIYNDYYIYYGLFTVVFGVLAHVVYLFWSWIFRESQTKNKHYWLVHISNVGLSILWVSLTVHFYW